MKNLFGGILFSCVLAAIPAWGQTYRPGQGFTDCTGCPEMVVVPAGHFVMGSTKAERARLIESGVSASWFKDEQPRHRVTIRRFAMGKYEVTRGQYEAFVRETGRGSGVCSVFAGSTWEDEPSMNWRNPGFEQTARDPVACVSWDDAKLYVAWLSRKTGKRYRLPSEAEWEYAARAGSRTAYWWGDAIGRNKANCKGCGSQWDGKRTAPVGSFRPNRFGLYDVHGNTNEWSEDCWHKNYTGAPANGRPWTTGDNCSERVLRGGSWDNIPRAMRSANRGSNDTGLRGDLIGFRVARTLP